MTDILNPKNIDEPQDVKKGRAVSIIIFLWILLFTIDYYCQFFGGYFWVDHILPFLKKIRFLSFLLR